MHNNNANGQRMSISGFRTSMTTALLVLLLSPHALANDFPTEARVDYVLGCMASNGQGYLVMQKCSCSIDAIAEQLPYKEYEEVETIVRMHEKRGELGVLFRTDKSLAEQLQNFRSIQADASLRCF